MPQRGRAAPTASIPGPWLRAGPCPAVAGRSTAGRWPSHPGGRLPNWLTCTRPSRSPARKSPPSNRRSARIQRPQGRPNQSRSVMAATEPTSGRNTVSVHTGLPGSLAQPPPHGPFRDLSLDAASRPRAAVRFPLPRSWRSRPAPIRVSPRHRAPARPVRPSSSPLMRFTTLIGMARTDLSAADGRAPGHRQERGRSVADTHDIGGWFTAAGGRRPSEGPVPDVRPEGSGQRPRRSGSLEAIRAATAAWLGVTYRCKVVSRGRAAPPRHRAPVPVRGAPPPRAAGWSSTSSRPWPS